MIVIHLLLLLSSAIEKPPVPTLSILTSQIDTTIAVAAVATLELINTAGKISITTWDRPYVRVRATGQANDPVDIHYSNGVLHIRTRSAKRVVRPTVTIGPGNAVTANVMVRSTGGPLPRADYEIVVPAAMSLDIAGIYSDIDIRGSLAAVHATAVHGDLSLAGGKGTVQLENLEGKVRVDGVNGTLVINAPNNDVAVFNSSGSVTVQSVNGAVVVAGGNPSSVRVRTYNGSVELSSHIIRSGSYSLSTFNGAARLNLPSGQPATVDASTIRGKVVVRGSGDARLNDARNRGRVLLAGGGALVTLETFNGDIEIDTRKAK